MSNFEQNDQGRYLSQGLDEKKFNQLFKLIEKEQKQNRRNAQRTLTPQQLRAKKASDLARLGQKKDGSAFTVDDLKQFEKSARAARQKYDSSRDGIRYAQLIAGSRDIDIKRANNRSGDGRGITRATLSAINANQIQVRVKASSVSVHEEHRVKIRLEEWDNHLLDPPDRSYQKAVKSACAGRLSFDCSCGRHQYWYRYIATVGRYAITPPKEFSYPKIRNPNLKGVACKHVLKAAVMLQSAVWHNLLVPHMKSQAKRISFGDDSKYARNFTEEEKQQGAKNRSTQINQQKVKAEFERYKRAEKAMANKMKIDEKAIEKARKTAQKAKKQQETIKRQNQTIKKQNNELSAMRDLVKSSFSMLSDAYKLMGKSQDDAMKDFAKNQGMTLDQLRKIVK